MLGLLLGAMLGSNEPFVGTNDGMTEGFFDGVRDGSEDGPEDGSSEGSWEGSLEGFDEGTSEGDAVGLLVLRFPTSMYPWIFLVVIRRPRLRLSFHALSNASSNSCSEGALFFTPASQKHKSSSFKKRRSRSSSEFASISSSSRQSRHRPRIRRKNRTFDKPPTSAEGAT